MKEQEVRDLAPQVLGILVRRGVDFAAAEDAVQEALVEAVRRWPEDPPDEPKAWLVTVAWRKVIDAGRSEQARRAREHRVAEQPPAGETEDQDDTLLLLFLCCHPALSDQAAVALTLRAVGGLTTRQIAEAYLVPETTMAQRITRAKRTVGEAGVGAPGDLRRVLTVLYLVFNAGHTDGHAGVDLAVEAVRLTRALVRASDEPEVAGLLALMLLHHARRPARWTGSGSLVPLAEQDRSLWDTALVTEGVSVLQGALARDRRGEYQFQAAIAALHCDAPTTEETDWPQVLEWYDELVALTDSPVVALNRAVALAEVDGPLVALRALADLPADLPRRTAVEAWLHERAGDLDTARALYVEAAARAGNLAERDHLTRQAARLSHVL